MASIYGPPLLKSLIHTYTEEFPLFGDLFYFIESRLNGVILEAAFNNMTDGIKYSPLAAVSLNLSYALL